MGKKDRKDWVLRLLAESGLALTPYVIFRNVKLQGATFERRSVANYLRELTEEGYVERITFEEGDSLYRVTDAGREYFDAAEGEL